MLLQDEPFHEAQRLSRWFASRADARWVVRKFWVHGCMGANPMHLCTRSTCYKVESTLSSG